MLTDNNGTPLLMLAAYNGTPGSTIVQQSSPTSTATGSPPIAWTSNAPSADYYGFWYLLVLGVLYFLLSVVAYQKKPRHHNAEAIFALNLFLGWTGLGWIIALVLALTRPAPRQA